MALQITDPALYKQAQKAATPLLEQKGLVATLDKITESLPGGFCLVFKDSAERIYYLQNKKADKAPAHEPPKWASQMYKDAHVAAVPIILKDGTWEAINAIAEALVIGHGMLLRICQDVRTKNRAYENRIVGVIWHLYDGADTGGGSFLHPAFDHHIDGNELLFTSPL